MTPKRVPRRIKNGDAPYILSPKNDYVFRYLFGEEGNEELLTSLISAILGWKITHATIKNPYILKLYYDTKECILDIKAEIDENVQVDIEMQLWRSPKLLNRILLYWSRLYASQMKAGDGYHVLKKTISILILDDDPYHTNDFHVCSRIRNFEEMFELTDLLEIHILELPKLHKRREQDTNDKLIPWMNFLYAQTREELDMASEANPVIRKAADMLMAMSRDEEERLRYEAREEFLLDQQYGLQAARGEGIEEGILKNKQETARKLIKKGMDDQFIREITGLELEEISSIRNEKEV
ncbi:MAG: Rpn family recombination-promoting nuclease/putative transposase [Candidatus Cloacimonetes bacterium]|nr:Rpn family recombination-promoting nuclease/putative transposase [Candidatus Cloacimonadota bacterium]